MENDKKVSCNAIAILYVLLSYVSPFIGLGLAMKTTPKIMFLALAMPFFIGILSAIYIRIYFQKISRITLLRCAIIIKYLLIPMYILGGLMIYMFLLLTFSPVPIMLFVGPAVIAMLSVYGYLTMLGGNAFSFAYIKKAKEEGIHGVFPSTMGKIFQFFFVADVISLAILSLKEKKYVGATVTVIIILILGFIATSSWFIVNLVALFR